MTDLEAAVIQAARDEVLTLKDWAEDHPDRLYHFQRALIEAVEELEGATS